MLQIRSCQVLFLSFLLFQPYLFSLPIFEFLHATNFSPYCNVPCSLTNSLVVISHHQDIALQYVLRCCPSSFFSLHFASSLFTCLVTVHVWSFFIAPLFRQVFRISPLPLPLPHRLPPMSASSLEILAQIHCVCCILLISQMRSTSPLVHFLSSFPYVSMRELDKTFRSLLPRPHIK